MEPARVWCILRILAWMVEGLACLAISKRAQVEYPKEYGEWPHPDWITLNIAWCILVLIFGSAITVEAFRHNKIQASLWCHLFFDTTIQIGLIAYISNLRDAWLPGYVFILSVVLIGWNLIALGCDVCLLFFHYRIQSYHQLP